MDCRRVSVGSVAVDPARDTLSKGGVSLAVEPRLMDLLMDLVREPDAVHARTDLIDSVWGANFGRDEGLTKAVSQLRHAFAELSPHETFIETVPKRGYRLVAPVADLAPPAANGAGPGQGPGLGHRMLTLARAPALVVLAIGYAGAGFIRGRRGK